MASKKQQQTRMGAVFDHLCPLGFSKSLIRKKVNLLLKVYGDEGWVFFEEDAYKLLIEAILEEQEKLSLKDCSMEIGAASTSSQQPNQNAVIEHACIEPEPDKKPVSQSVVMKAEMRGRQLEDLPKDILKDCSMEIGAASTSSQPLNQIAVIEHACIKTEPDKEPVSQSVVMEAEMGGRRWEDLPEDILVSIFTERLRAEELEFVVPKVCSSWRRASRHPMCERVFDPYDSDDSDTLAMDLSLCFDLLLADMERFREVDKIRDVEHMRKLEEMRELQRCRSRRI